MEMNNSSPKSLTFEEILADALLGRYHKAAFYYYLVSLTIV
jgi:hypothetical protein